MIIIADIEQHGFSIMNVDHNSLIKYVNYVLSETFTKYCSKMKFNLNDCNLNKQILLHRAILDQL